MQVTSTRYPSPHFKTTQQRCDLNYPACCADKLCCQIKLIPGFIKCSMPDLSVPSRADALGVRMGFHLCSTFDVHTDRTLCSSFVLHVRFQRACGCVLRYSKQSSTTRNSKGSVTQYSSCVTSKRTKETLQRM